jgi:hypothetical protein
VGAVWPREIGDDLRHIVLWVEFVFDGGEGAQKELVTEGEDGSAPAGDAAVDEESGELGEEVMDFDGGVEGGEVSPKAELRSVASDCWSRRAA